MMERAAPNRYRSTCAGLRDPPTDWQPAHARSTASTWIGPSFITVLAIVAGDGAINRLLRCPAIRDWVKHWRLARSRCLAPVDHVPVIATVGVERQAMVRQESPALRISRHWQ